MFPHDVMEAMLVFPAITLLSTGKRVISYAAKIFSCFGTLICHHVNAQYGIKCYKENNFNITVIESCFNVTQIKGNSNFVTETNEVITYG